MRRFRSTQAAGDMHETDDLTILLGHQQAVGLEIGFGQDMRFQQRGGHRLCQTPRLRLVIPEFRDPRWIRIDEGTYDDQNVSLRGIRSGMIKMPLRDLWL